MTGVHSILLILALVCFLLATVDWPTGSSGRLVAGGLFLLTLAQLVGVR